MDLSRTGLRLLGVPRNQGIPFPSVPLLASTHNLQGPTLEEISKIFDGDDAVAHIDLAEIENIDLAEIEKEDRHGSDYDLKGGAVEHVESVRSSM